MNVTEALIADIVHRVMEAGDFLGAGQTFKKERDPSGVTHIQTSTVICEPFEGREDVRLKDVMTLEEAPRMGAGIMEVDHTDFAWTLNYDEYDMILEGTLEIVIDERVMCGEAGDILYIPKGSHIHFRSPDKARFAYFVYPADWQ